MRIILAGAAVLALSATAAISAGDSFSAPEARYVADTPPPPPLSLYERIAAHYGPMGRDVKEEFRDGPCRVERRWEKDGDYEERIKCRGPRRD